MSLMITNECIGCGACIDECPNGAIDELGTICNIEADLCTECIGYYDEPFCISVCPVDSIVSDPDNIESIDELTLKYQHLTSKY